MTSDLESFHELLMRKGIAFVRFRLPGQPNAKTYISYLPESFSDLNYLFSNKKKGFVFAPFQTNKETPIWFLTANEIIDDGSDLQQQEEFLLQLPDRIQYIQHPEIPSTSKNKYSDSFSKLMQDLETDQIDKVILSKIVSKQRNNETLFELFARLSKTYPQAFTYFIHLNTGELWMGASPELLLEQKENEIRTMALAGTQTLANQELANLVWNTKEQKEQAYVADYVGAILQSRVGMNGFEQSETYSVQAGNLAHLRTDFRIQKDVDRTLAFDLIKKLHPTPAVCGIPLEAAKNKIEKTETHRRKYYTGFLGPIHSDSLSLFVNLRCMQILPEYYALYVGGGITRDSELEKEWLETEAKAQTLLSVIQSN